MCATAWEVADAKTWVQEKFGDHEERLLVPYST